MLLLIAQPILDTVDWSAFTTQASKTLAIILVGHDPASELYVSIKQRKAEQYNVTVEIHRLDDTATTEEVINLIHTLNSTAHIDGIIVQLPLPASFDAATIIAAIDPTKDVDNLTGSSHYLSPMVHAVQAMIDHYQLDFTDKKICVVGQGVVVGKPLTDYFTVKGYAVTVVDIDTPHADDIIHASDIVFGATGVKHRIGSTHTHTNQIVFDCSGVDVDFDSLTGNVSALTPSKGGLGPLTVHFLFMNIRSL